MALLVWIVWNLHHGVDTSAAGWAPVWYAATVELLAEDVVLIVSCWLGAQRRRLGAR